jgi:hypothetical protein
MAVSTAASVVEAKRWIDDYIDLEQTIADLIDRKKELPEDSAEYQLIERVRPNARENGQIRPSTNRCGYPRC